MRIFVLLLGALALTECGASPEVIYLRLDGQVIASNPLLREQLDRDRNVCEREGDTQYCMAVKGYVSVSPDRAAIKQQQLAATAAQNAELKNTVVLPPPTQRNSNPPATIPKSSQD